MVSVCTLTVFEPFLNEHLYARFSYDLWRGFAMP